MTDFVYRVSFASVDGAGSYPADFVSEDAAVAFARERWAADRAVDPANYWGYSLWVRLVAVGERPDVFRIGRDGVESWPLREHLEWLRSPEAFREWCGR